MPARLLRLLTLSLCLLYWAVSLRHLAVAPPVYEDEPWQASTGWKLATQGVFGSDMFAGFYGMERHYYAFMPVHPLLLAATFKFAGLGLFQARFETVALGLLVLALTVALGRRLHGEAGGLLAALLLISVRLTALPPSQLTGIVLLDMARIARYDMAATAFGLAALLVYLRRGGSGWAGLLAALAGLSHLHGLFWAVALGLLALWDRIPRREALALAAGFVAPWLIYGGYVLGGVADWRGQTREYGPRFGLLDPAWYLANLADEWRRYSPGLGPAGVGWLARPGWWAALLGWPLSLLALARRATQKGDRPARALFVPALVVPVCFALLIQSKLSNYLIAVAPLGALVVAWGGLALWRWAGQARRGVWIRAGLAAVLALVCAEGATRLAAGEAAAAAATPYANYIREVRAEIPAGARVLGLHNYWFGLGDLDYRAWPVPLWLADPAHRSPPLTMDEALDEVAPNVILIDPRMRDFFADGSDAARAAQGWMDRRGYVLAAAVEDPTYGRMDIFRAPD